MLKEPDYVIAAKRNMENFQCSSLHMECFKLRKQILDNIQIGNIYPPYILELYIKCLTKGSYNYYDYSKKCITKMENFKDSIAALIAFNCPNIPSLNLLIDNNAVQVIQMVIDNEYELQKSVLDYAINTGKTDIANMLSKYGKIEVTSTQLDCAVAKNMENVVMNILTRKISPSKNTVALAVKNRNLQLVKTLMNIGCFNLDSSLLIEACRSKDNDLIRLFLDLKIIPTRECFNALVTSETHYDYGYYNRRYNNKGPYISDSALIDLLINYGYKLDSDDVVLATKSRIKINNIELYDIKLDEKYLEVCAECNFYPYEIKNIQPTVKCLEKACTKFGNLQTIKQLVTSGIKPNNICIQEACKHKNNIQAIKFLIENGAKPDFDCIVNFADVLRNRTLSYIIEEYKKVVNDVKNDKVELKVDKVEVKVDKVELNDEIERSEEEEEEEEADEEEPKPTQKQVSDSDSTSSESESDIEPPPKIIVKKARGRPKKTYVDDKQSKQIIVKGKPKKNTEENPPKQEIITINKSNKEIKLKEDYQLNDNLSIMLTSKKGVKMTYLEVKQKLLEHIKNNNLFDQNNKLLINIDNEFSKISGYKVGLKMNFVDFDNFVSVCLFR